VRIVPQSGTTVTLDNRPGAPTAGAGLPRGARENVPREQKEFTFIRRRSAERLDVVIGSGEESAGTRRLTELQLASPADATLRNLLGVLNAKLELCARLPVFAWEAGHDGHHELAASFTRLAEAERTSCALVLDELRGLLQIWAFDKEKDR
jgi:hypothetical protein